MRGTGGFPTRGNGKRESQPYSDRLDDRTICLTEVNPFLVGETPLATSLALNLSTEPSDFIFTQIPTYNQRY
jgi:hypothetical protein